MLGPWAGNVIAIAAILKASGSLVGWILIAAQSSQAAAADGMSGTLDMGEYLMAKWSAKRHDYRRG